MTFKMLRPLAVAFLANPIVAAVLSAAEATITAPALLPRAESIYGWYAGGSVSGSTIWNAVTYHDTVVFSTSASLYGFCDVDEDPCELYYDCSSGYILYGTTSFNCEAGTSICSYNLLYSTSGASNPKTGYWCDDYWRTGAAIYQTIETESPTTPTSSSTSTTTPIPPTPVPPTSTSPVPPPPSSSDGKAKTGIIVGGVVGGIALIGIIAVAIIVLLRRGRKNNTSPPPAPPIPPMQSQFQPPPNQYQPQPNNGGYPVVGAVPLPAKAAEEYTTPVAVTPINQTADSFSVSYYAQGNEAQSPVQPASPAPQYQHGSPVPQYQASGQQWQSHVQGASELPEVRH